VSPIAARDRLALALDLPLAQAEELYQKVSPYFAIAKVGLSLFAEYGPAAVERLQRLGAGVFLDLKLHDIPNTVELAASRCAEMGVRYLTVHALGGPAMLRAAQAGAEKGAAKKGVPVPQVLAVTVLTSLSSGDLEAIGHEVSPRELTLRLARLALDCGVAGLVCSPQEVGDLRTVLGPKPFLCTPGIRMPESARGDQERVATPQEAVRSGADLLVVGRPIHAAEDPVEAARQLFATIAATDI
jgi:orotidine-5'-phosphate decarboxylase